MKILLVDDEQLQLEQFEGLLSQLGYKDIVGSCSRAADAILVAEKTQPDLIFLDIVMPGMGGLDAVIPLMRVSPLSKIIFLTAYTQYAVQAYEHDAIDYLIKPVRLERLEQSFERLHQRFLKNNIEATRIQLMPSLHILNRYGQIRNIPFRSEKIKELFACLLHHRNFPVDKSDLQRWLLPDDSSPTGHAHQLYTLAYEVRKLCSTLFSKEELLLHEDEDSFMLVVNDMVTDAEEWEASLEQLNKQNASNDISSLHSVFYAYKGHYLAAEQYQWAKDENERLKCLFRQLGIDLIRLYREEGHMDKAIKVQERLKQLG